MNRIGAFYKLLSVTLLLTLQFMGNSCTTDCPVCPDCPVQDQSCIDYGEYLHWAGHVDTPGFHPCQTMFSDGYAYVAAHEGILIYDIADIANPACVSTLETPGRAYDITVQSGYAYVASYDNGLHIIDVSDPETPSIVSTTTTPGLAYGVALSGAHALVGDHDSGLQVIDISSPYSPFIAGSMYGGGWGYHVSARGGIAYLCAGAGGLQLVDITLPSAPALLSSVGATAHDAEVRGDYAYCAAWDNGFFIADVSDAENPSIVSSVSISGFTKSISLNGGLAYLSNDEYGLVVVDVGDPQAPSILGTHRTPGLGIGVDTYNDHAFIADYEAGIHIIDATHPVGVNTISHISLSSATDIACTDSYAFVASFDGLHVVDIGSNWSPAIVAELTSLGWFQGLGLVGDYLYGGGSSHGLHIIDVSSPTSPVWLTTMETPWVDAWEVAVQGSFAYITDGRGGLHILDVSSPASPRITGSIAPTLEDDTWIDVDVHGTYAYVTTNQGLFQAIDISDCYEPFLVGSATIGDTAGNEPYAWEATLHGSIAFLVNRSSTMYIISIRSPGNPEVVGTLRLPGDAIGVVADGNCLYIGIRDDTGLVVADISAPNEPCIIGTIHGFSDELYGLPGLVGINSTGVYLLGTVYGNNFYCVPRQCLR